VVVGRGAGLVPWVGGHACASFGFYLRGAFHTTRVADVRGTDEQQLHKILH